jgi:predicted ATP-dependent serine protease
MFRFPTLALAALTTVTALAQQPAQKRKVVVGEVRATGCIRKGQGNCLLLKTLDGKTTYTFIVAPKPDLGVVVTIQGKPHSGPTACRQGIPVDVSDWEPTGEKCAE